MESRKNYPLIANQPKQADLKSGWERKTVGDLFKAIKASKNIHETAYKLGMVARLQSLETVIRKITEDQFSKELSFKELKEFLNKIDPFGTSLYQNLATPLSALQSKAR